MARVETNFQRRRMADINPKRGPYRPLSRSHRMASFPAAFVDLKGFSGFSIRTGKEIYSGLEYAHKWAQRKVTERHEKRNNELS
jgi:hypothetical protein